MHLFNSDFLRPDRRGYRLFKCSGIMGQEPIMRIRVPCKCVAVTA